MTTPVHSAAGGPEEEAARYALLRRLAPSMRHHLVVNLQPIGMVYEVMERRLRQPEPHLGEVHESAQKINGLARAALASCLDVVTWLAPEDVLTPTKEGVRECLGLIATSLTFRGYALRNQVLAEPGQVGRSAIRTVLTAALLHVTDQNPAPADLLIAAEGGPGGVDLTLTLQPTEGEGGFTAESAYRRIAWADVKALAAAESVSVAREGSQRVRLKFPLGTVVKD